MDGPRDRGMPPGRPPRFCARLLAQTEPPGSDSVGGLAVWRPARVGFKSRQAAADRNSAHAWRVRANMAKVKCPRCFYVNPDGQETCVRCKTALPKIKIEAAQPASSPPPANQDEVQLRRGQVLANRYTVLNLIGRGGMGCIYKVHDNVLGEDVALKTLLPQFVQDKLVLERFFNEARIARRLAHPNIVRVHDIGSAS
ncbi:MAG TPA: hypothetical protein ENN65_01260, partial [Candidatus Hydrogenedentes bacterium]|nr:hypothetical protein [Candidatus Hydrogenedentota bacterium]